MLSKEVARQMQLNNGVKRGLISDDNIGAIHIRNCDCGIKVNLFEKGTQLNGKIGGGMSFYSKLIIAKGVTK